MKLEGVIVDFDDRRGTGFIESDGRLFQFVYTQVKNADKWKDLTGKRVFFDRVVVRSEDYAREVVLAD